MHITLSKSIATSKTKDEAAHCTEFESQTLDLGDESSLRQFFSSGHCYSAFLFDGGKRSAANALRMTCLIVDVDEGISIAEAIAKLKQYVFILHTTTSHRQDVPKKGGIQDRFRIIFPLTEKAQRLIRFHDSVAFNEFRQSITKLFPFVDARALSVGQMCYPSFGDTSMFELRVNNADSTIDVTYSRTISDDPSVRLADGTAVLLSSITKHAVIHCPYHDDHHPSANVWFNADQKCLTCSSCNVTWYVAVSHGGFHANLTPEKLDDHVRQENLFMVDTRMYRITSALNPAQLDHVDFGVKYPSQLKPLRDAINRAGRRYGSPFTLERLSSHDTEHPPVVFMQDGFRIYHHIRACDVFEIDKTKSLFEFIFREHVDFIWNWLAVYTCQNHRRLPTIVLTGPRGIGKSTLIDFVRMIFPDRLCAVQRTLDENFQSHCTKKLLALDEFDGTGRDLYTEVKSIQGFSTRTVNEKYEKPYNVPNNVNLIVVSNRPQPIFFESHEIPENPNENGFFILDLSFISKATFPLSREEVKQVVAGAPNFAREFLVPRYKEIEANSIVGSARFTIPCPITPDELFMFSESTTELEDISENVLRRILLEHPDEVAITPMMIENALEGVSNHKHFTKLSVKRCLIKTGHIAREQTLKCRTTEKKNTGYKILKFPEPTPEDQFHWRPFRPYPNYGSED